MQNRNHAVCRFELSLSLNSKVIKYWIYKFKNIALNFLMLPFRREPDDFNDLLLIGFDKISTNDTKHFNRMVHFFLYDYKFERIWKKPDADLEKLKCYRAVLSPDFSMYIEMAPVLQLYNTFRNRWCGAVQRNSCHSHRQLGKRKYIWVLLRWNRKGLHGCGIHLYGIGAR